MEKKSTAILIDGGWFSMALRDALPNTFVDAGVIHKNARALLGNDEELFRIFYYDSDPYAKTETNPISKRKTDYSKNPACETRLRFFKELGQMDFVALRRGSLKASGWELTEHYLGKLMKGNGGPPTENDVKLGLEQKGVDMRIGIDVATLSLKRIVERVILVSGDTDMIPAMKLARREGVQVVLAVVGGRRPCPELIEDADLVRQLNVTA